MALQPTKQTSSNGVLDEIKEFARIQKNRPGNPTFYMKDLMDHVLESFMVSPETPGRLLRHLKSRGELDYVVINRRRSLYRFM